jgi:hypothetical protein
MVIDRAAPVSDPRQLPGIDFGRVSDPQEPIWRD